MNKPGETVSQVKGSEVLDNDEPLENENLENADGPGEGDEEAGSGSGASGPKGGGDEDGEQNQPGEGEQKLEESEEGGKSAEGEEAAEGGEESPAVQQLQTKIAELEEKLKTAPAPAPAQPVHLTDEQKQAYAEKFGVQEFKTIEAFSNMAVNIVQAAVAPLIAELSTFKVDAAINNLAKDPKFADVGKYRKGMDEVLKNYAPASRSDPKILESAYYEAKGRGASAVQKKIVTSKTVNLKVLKSAAGHNKPGGKGGARTAIKLTESQKAAARQANMSEAEYIRWMR